jgi:hypothetical protein
MSRRRDAYVLSLGEGTLVTSRERPPRHRSVANCPPSHGPRAGGQGTGEIAATSPVVGTIVGQTPAFESVGEHALKEFPAAGSCPSRFGREVAKFLTSARAGRK